MSNFKVEVVALEEVLPHSNAERLVLGRKDVLELYTSGQSLHCPSHIREGVVIRPVKERVGEKTDRVIFKSVSQAYLTRKGGTELN